MEIDYVQKSQMTKKEFQQSSMMTAKKELFSSTMDYTLTGPEIDPEKGYAVIEIGDVENFIKNKLQKLKIIEGIENYEMDNFGRNSRIDSGSCIIFNCLT